MEDGQDLANLPIKLMADKLSVFYGKYKAVDEITMQIPKNRITALIGPSGCGKSTLLRSFNRMNDLVSGSHVEGQVLLDGKNIYDPDVDVVDIRQRIGMVFQRPNPFPMSVLTTSPLAPTIRYPQEKCSRGNCGTFAAPGRCLGRCQR